MQAGPLDAQRLDSGAAIDQRLEQGLGAAGRELEGPFAIGVAGVGRKRLAPGAVGGSGAQPDDGTQAAPCLVDGALERDLASRDDGDALAQPLGMGYEMGL